MSSNDDNLKNSDHDDGDNDDGCDDDGYDDGGYDDDGCDDGGYDDGDLEIVSLLKHKQLTASLVRLVPAVGQLVAPTDHHRHVIGYVIGW